METENMQKYTDYFEGALSRDAQGLMLCLAPFVDQFHGGWKGFYTDRLMEQSELAGLPYDQWDALLKDAENHGFINPHDHFGGMGYLTLEPMFSVFLKTRLENAPQPLKKAIGEAFCVHYNEIGGQLARLIRSDESDARQTGQALIGLENENLLAAVTIGLLNASEFYQVFDALSFLMIQRKNFDGLTKLSQWVLTQQKNYSSEQLAGDSGTAFFTVNDRLAGAFLSKGDLKSAKGYYENGLTLSAQSNDPHVRTIGKAQSLGQLVRIALEQGVGETAIDHALEAAGLFVQNGEESGYMWVVTMLAWIWRKTQDDAIPEALGKLKGQSRDEAKVMLTRINQPRNDEPV